MLRLGTLLGLLGLALATALLIGEGFADVMGALATAGWGILLASLFHIVPMAVNGRAWQVLMPGRRTGGIVLWTALVWVREAVNGLLPVARVGGEVVCGRLMLRRGFRVAPSVSSLVLDMTLSLLSQFLFTLVGLGLLLLRTDDQAIILRLGLGMLILLPLMALFIVVQRRGLFSLAAGVVGKLFGDRWGSLGLTSRRLDRAVRQGWRRTDRVGLSLALQLVGWILGGGEIWLVLHFMGHTVSIWDAILIEALIQAIASAAFIVPGAIGVQEGGFLLLGALVGLPPDVALALALARRARDLILFVPALIGWQLLEGRALLKRRAAAPAAQAGGGTRSPG
ncbi:lysylphosphatidylglycerol synthase domain-containing protein [Zavarzinia sp. CC-PAN008]|uniref:lysylphosphatidylglycerol synthase domain-containing protein n=1 Tax=Zavarzinia sp. CC-PAN008 TaxID=3243332 RepID=UPI003F7436B4